MKTLLVPTDFSPNSYEALDYAIELARHNWTEIIVVHACDFEEYAFKDRGAKWVAEKNRKTREEIEGKFSLLEKSIFRTEGIKIKTALYDGTVVESILEAAHNYGADLIIMGTVGQTGLKTKLLGSKSMQVLRKSKIPVLVVPPDFAWRTPKHIAIAVNNEHEEIVYLSNILDLVQIYDPEITALIFSAEGDKADQVMTDTRTIFRVNKKLKGIYKDLDIERTMVSGHDFIGAVTDYIENKDIQLLVMFNHHTSWLDYFLNSSQTQKMVQLHKVPILSIHAGTIIG